MVNTFHSHVASTFSHICNFYYKNDWIQMSDLGLEMQFEVSL